MPRSLVTGGAGFIGAHLTARAARPRPRCRRPRRPERRLPRERPPRVRGSSRARSSTRAVERCSPSRALRARLPLRAYAAEGLSHFIKRFNYTNNVIGSVNLINAVGEPRGRLLRLHLVDRGLRRGPGADDRGPAPGARGHLRDRQVRGRAGARGHPRDVRARLRDLPPAQRLRRAPEHRRPYRNVLGIFINQIMRGEPLSIFGDGEQSRAFTTSATSCRRSPTPRHAGRARRGLQRGRRRALLDQRPGRDRQASYGRARSSGPPPRGPQRGQARVLRSLEGAAGLRRRESTSLEEGVERMAEWAREHGPRTTPPFTGIEIERGLPPSWRQETSRG